MILKGNARGGAKDLAAHLMKEENEHVELYELRGFASESLMGALNEAYAISRGTRCKQFLYSLSLNPPETEVVPIEEFEAAINRVEEQLGLTGQPRAIVFHEKEGRRHAHAVWSRIDVHEMKAVQLSYDRTRLKEISRELFLEHGWKMPHGLSDSRNRDPRNFTLAEWQQAKRTGQDAREIKAAIQDAWAVSDSLASFSHALEELGFKLARGNKNRIVAVGLHGDVHAIARQTGQKAKDVKARLGNPKDLPSVEDAQQSFAQDMGHTLAAMQERLRSVNTQYEESYTNRRDTMVQSHRIERKTLLQTQETRNLEDAKARQARFRKGLGGIWDRLRGEHKRIRLLNEREAEEAVKRDRSEKEQLVQKQLAERRHLNLFRMQVKQIYQGLRREIERDRP